MKSTPRCLLLAAVWFSGMTVAHADIVVIVHPQASFNTLTLSEARQLFMDKSKRLPDGQTAAPVMPPEHSALRKAFDRLVLDRDSKQMRAYWAQMIFTGRGKPPRHAENDEAMKQEVSTTPNAVGYIDQRSLDRRVKVVLTIASEP